MYFTRRKPVDFCQILPASRPPENCTLFAYSPLPIIDNVQNTMVLILLPDGVLISQAVCLIGHSLARWLEHCYHVQIGHPLG